MASLTLFKKLHKPTLLWKRTFTHLTKNKKKNGVQGFVSIGKIPIKQSNVKFLSPKYIQFRELKLSSINRTTEAECETAKQQTTCHKEKPKKPKCEPVKIPKWTGQCLKVCLPCCRPIEVPLSCDEVRTSVNVCKSINYKYPSYTETVNKVSFYELRRDCCYDPKCMQIYGVGTMSEKMKLKDVQKIKLGLSKNSTRFFSTNARLHNKEEKKGKDVSSLKQLPCIKKSDDIKGGKKPIAAKGDCMKLCMPCCKPARDPPDCFFPYVKQKCHRHRAPRPAYSECQADKASIPQPCECTFVILPRCDQTKKGDDKAKCSKKKK